METAVQRQLNPWALFSGFFLIPVALCPGFGDPYIQPKWIAFYLLSVAALLPCLFKENSRVDVPRVHWRAWILLLAVAGGVGMSLILNFPGRYLSHFLDWACFFVVSFSAFQFGREEEWGWALYLWNALGTISLLVYGYLQWAGLEIFSWATSSIFPVSSFGFQNMTAEWLGISILLQIYFLRNTNSKRSIKVLLLGLSIVLFFSLKARASLLAFLMAMVPLLRIQMSWRNFLKVLSVIFVALVAYTSWVGEGQALVKARNVRIRFDRWLNTSSLISENPWGLGPGKFEFGYLSYANSVKRDEEANEQWIIRSPHNGYLEAISELGWLAGGGILGLCFALLVLLFRKLYGSLEICGGLRIVTAVLVYLAVDAFFSFPMEIPFPFYVCAVFLGLGLRQCCGPVHPWVVSRIGISGLLIVISSLATASGFSYWVSSHDSMGLRAQRLGCEVFPDNWQGCIRASQLELKLGNPEQALQLLNRVLLNDGNHFIALRAKADVYSSLGKFNEACDALAQYDQLFWEESSVHDEWIRFCQ